LLTQIYYVNTSIFWVQLSFMMKIMRKIYPQKGGMNLLRVGCIISSYNLKE